VTVYCTTAQLAGGDSFTLTVQVQVGPPAIGTISNTAVAATSTFDENPDNNTATEETTVLGPDIEVTKTDDADPVPLGGAFSYVITVTNQGAGTAEDVTLDDTLPSGLAYVDANLSGAPGVACVINIAPDPVTVYCTTAQLAGGDSFTLTVQVQVGPPAIGTISNTAVAATSTFDENPVPATIRPRKRPRSSESCTVTSGTTSMPTASGSNLMSRAWRTGRSAPTEPVIQRTALATMSLP